MENERICGIYSIENLVNHKFYIGESTRIYGRWEDHISQLRGNRHGNIYLQRAWNKYGEENFKFSIVEICKPKQRLKREKYWVKFYDSFYNGYNMNEGGENPQYLKNDKGEIYYTGLKCSQLTDEKVKEIVQKMLNGDSDRDIANEYNVSINTINRIRNHKTWCRFTDGITFPQFAGRKVFNKMAKPVDMYYEDGTYICTFESAHEVERKIGIGYRLVSSVCRGTSRIANGYIFRFTNHPFNEFDTKKPTSPLCVKVDQFDDEWNYIQTFDSIRQAEEYIGVGWIWNSIVRHNKSGGYYWKYHDDNEVKEEVS